MLLSGPQLEVDTEKLKDVAENVTEVAKEAAKDAVGGDVDKKLSVFQQFLKDLPTKALSLGIRIGLALIALFVGIWLIRIIRKIIKKSLQKAKVDEGVVQFTDSLLKVLLTVVLVMMIAVNFGVDAASVVAILGSVGVALSLAVQGSLSNFAGGVLILLFKPFKIGDLIKEDGHGNMGVVTEITLFYTKLLTMEKHVIILPNGNLANTSLVNYTSTPYRRLDLTIPISYEANIKKAKKVAERVLQEEPLVVLEEPMWVYVGNIGDSAIDISMYCFVQSKDYFLAKGILLESLKLAFDENRIEIPYPQLDVHMQR
ncbi:MAG: mechanosensitive ion channel family protein [Lachnospiraceae bacterium]|nr:mechanosensitive ion channel family protein [Lachnospiraceae bacterium]